MPHPSPKTAILVSVIAGAILLLLSAVLEWIPWSGRSEGRDMPVAVAVVQFVDGTSGSTVGGARVRLPDRSIQHADQNGILICSTDYAGETAYCTDPRGQFRERDLKIPSPGESILVELLPK